MSSEAGPISNNVVTSPEGVLPGKSTTPARSAFVQALRDGYPYFYLSGAFAAIFATAYVSEWFWVVPHLVLLAAGGLHLLTSIVRRTAGSRQRRNKARQS